MSTHIHALSLIAAVTAAAAFTAAAQAGEETIIVTATGDSSDFGGAQQVDDLPGPDGVVTIREAILAANNTPGPQTIAFNIPTSDPGFDGAVFRTFVGVPALTLTDDGTSVDGATQTKFTGDTNPSGPEITYFAELPGGASIPGLRIDSSGNLVRGIGGFNFFQYAIEINGDTNTIQGVFTVQSGSASLHVLGADNVIGGTREGEGNRLSSNGIGVWIRGAGATGNTVLGNLIPGNRSDGINIESNGNIIGGTTAAARNVIRNTGHFSGEGSPVGAQVCISGDNNIVRGNYLGLAEDGVTDESGAARTGVDISGAHNLIGGKDIAARNVIAGHGFSSTSIKRHGILIVGGQGNTVQNNLLGISVDGGISLPNERNITVDVFLFDDVPHDVLIADNIIANSLAWGIGIAGFGSAVPQGISIRRNILAQNDGLGIDLGRDGVTMNDPGDDDTGENGLQNFPVLTAAAFEGASVMVQGMLDSHPDETYAVDVFLNIQCDPSGFGEGEIFIKSVEVMTDGAGKASFSVTSLSEPFERAFATATATRLSTGDSSEFSECLLVDSGGPSADLDGDGMVGFNDLLILLAAWGDCPDPPSECPADLDGNGETGFSDLLILLASWGAGRGVAGSLFWKGLVDHWCLQSSKL